MIRMGKDGEKGTQANAPFFLWSRAAHILVYSPPQEGKIPLKGKVREPELCGSTQRLLSPVHGSNSKTNCSWGFSPESTPAGKGGRSSSIGLTPCLLSVPLHLDVEHTHRSFLLCLLVPPMPGASRGQPVGHTAQPGGFGAAPGGVHGVGPLVGPGWAAGGQGPVRSSTHGRMLWGHINKL